MTEREPDEASQPRKRIAVACGRCRKRKIRCSGDPGNGGPCSNCKNAGHEPCLFLRVSSTETPLRDGEADFGYNVEAARAYHSRGAVSPHNPVPPYGAEIHGGEVMTYRHSTYPYGNSKSYYPNVTGWGPNTYGEDSVDYGLSYSSYAQMGQDSAHMVPSFRYTSSTKTPVYIDPEASNYSYGSLVHRPAVDHDLPTLSLSGMAASLPTSDRLPTISRTLPSTSTYRPGGFSGPYSGGKASHSSDVGYGNLNSSFDAYASTTTLPSGVAARTSHPDATAYQSTSSAASDSIYTAEHAPYRGVHESDSYIYSDRLDNSRRDSHASSGANAGSVLSNGQPYVPETQNHSSTQSYPISGALSTAAVVNPPASGVVEGATTAGAAGGASAASQGQSAGLRRSAGNLRGL